MTDHSTADQTGLTFDNVTISRADVPLICVNAHIAPGDVLTVMGPSGVGKSTLLAFAAGFLDPVFKAQGRVTIDGLTVTDLPAHQRYLGLLFQDPLLFPHLSVSGNLAFALPEGLRGKAQRRQAILDALSEVGLVDLADRDPATLSGGQRARIALMRVLISAPRALLLDEPFSKLDATLRDQIRVLVFDKARARGLPVLLVTHDAADAEAAGGQVIQL